MFANDTDQYYSYLVATFIEGDLSFSFDNAYWLHEGPKGILIQKMSCGVAIMELPFFLAAHFHCKLAGIEATGYNAIYNYWIAFGVLLYVFSAFIILRKLLLRYYSDFSVMFTLIALFLATNLMHYSIKESGMAHAFLFFVVTVILHFSDKYNREGKTKDFYLAIIFCGLATVMRPTHALSILVPLFYGIRNIGDFYHRIKSLLDLRIIFIAVVLFLIPVAPQLAYWKYSSGKYLYFSYSDEGFFFADPKIFDVLFSFRKGWLIYAPVMTLSLIGFFLKKVEVPTKAAFYLFFFPSLYIISCWWTWWYGGSYGMRTLIDFYPILAFGLAATIHKFSTSIAMKLVAVAMLALFVTHGVLGTVKYKYCEIHWDSMTAKAYFYNMTHWSFKGNAWEEFQPLLETPDYEGAKDGTNR